MKYYNVKVSPDVINGDVSTVIGTTGGDADFAGGDLVFDWTAFYIPKGTSNWTRSTAEEASIIFKPL